MNIRTLRILAWFVLGAIAVVTLSPIGFRPSLPVAPNLERAGAFLLAGAIFAAAYPRKIWFAATVVLVGVLGLEAAQNLQPSRHGRIEDTLVKAVAALIGIGMGCIVGRIFQQSPRAE
jgi:hypothetical protein